MKQTGFTLLECLVALTIVAVALSASIRAVGTSAQSLEILRERIIAGWVADNHLAKLRAELAWPALGRNSGEVRMAGHPYRWEEDVIPTPNPMFRRVNLQIFDAVSNTPLASASSFAVRPLE